jgi:dihydroorotase
VVFEHITTADAVAFVETAGANVAATITPHHLDFNRNAMFQGGIRPHFYCLPVAKREVHRLALRRAATSGSDRFFLGTDSAPHLVGTKECASGCAGVFSAPCAMETLLEVFEDAQVNEAVLEAFTSQNGARFYGLEQNKGTVAFARRPCFVPAVIAGIVPFRAGQELRWSRE